MMTAIFRGGASAIVAVALAVATASAQTAASEQAQRLFDEGLKLKDDGDIAQACARFEASQQLEPKVGTLLNLGECREENHQLATAWQTFETAEQQANRAGDPERAQAAAAHAARLKQRLSHLTIAVAPDRQIAGLAIETTIGPVDAASWNRAMPIDGGRYTITARAPGRVPWTKQVEVANANDALAVEIPRLEPVAAAPGSAGHRPSLVAPAGFGLGAIVLGGVAIGFEVSARDVYAKASASIIQKDRDSLEATANHRRYTAEAIGVAAAGCAGLAVYLVLRHRSDQAGAVVAPRVSPDGAGLALLGRW